MSLPPTSAFVRYIQPDGKLTSEGVRLFLSWHDELVALRAELTALQARVAALEP